MVILKQMKNFYETICELSNANTMFNDNMLHKIKSDLEEIQTSLQPETDLSETGLQPTFCETTNIKKLSNPNNFKIDITNLSPKNNHNIQNSTPELQKG